MEEKIICLNGKTSQICEQLKSYGILLDELETKKLLDAILSNKEYLRSEEKASCKTSMPNIQQGCLGLMIMDYSYHISIKNLTLCALAFIADKLTFGISDKILSAFGVPLQAVHAIDETNGEKCIVKETVLYHDKLGDENILDKFNGKCCNNDIRCKFRSGDKCKCTKSEIKDIYERLADKDVFKKVDLGYKIKW